MINLNKLWKNINVYNKMKRDIEEVEYTDINLKNYVIIDVRSRREYKEFHLSNSINIPLPDVKSKIENVVQDKNKKILVCCKSGTRSAKAVEILDNLGYKNVYNLKGGLENI